MNLPDLSERVLNVINKIKLIPDGSMENRTRNIRGVRMEIIKKNGEIVTETVLIPKGDPENPLNRDKIINKLKICALGQAGERKIQKLVEAIDEICGKKNFVNPMIEIG